MNSSTVKKYQICNRCVMDTSDKYIAFDENGICNHCHDYDNIARVNILPNQEKEEKLNRIVRDIKKEGKGKKYDCIAGLSGGLDSSYVLYLAKKFGLRTLIVHFDNGWDSELAIKNIENIVNVTGFDYYNYVVDWEEFKDLQLAYLKSSVVDAEIPTDMGIFSLIPKIALKYGIKNVLIGHNLVFEFTMGKDWNYTKMDRSNLESIYSKFSSKKLKSFPYYTPLEQLRYKVKGIKQINILWYSEFDYTKIKATLEREFNWRAYGVKHGESVFTKFYQSYYLPHKFGIDKRRAHLSDQIGAGKLSRKEALEILSQAIYSSAQEERREFEYVAKKLGITPEQLQEIIEQKPVPHQHFDVEKPYGSLFDRLVLRVLNVKKLVSAMIRLRMLFSR